MWKMPGENVVENKYKAFRLFLKAANNGFPDAIFWVGECYNLGWGVEQNNQLAFDYF